MIRIWLKEQGLREQTTDKMSDSKNVIDLTEETEYYVSIDIGSKHLAHVIAVDKKISHWSVVDIRLPKTFCPVDYCEKILGWIDDCAFPRSAVFIIEYQPMGLNSTQSFRNCHIHDMIHGMLAAGRNRVISSKPKDVAAYWGIAGLKYAERKARGISIVEELILNDPDLFDNSAIEIFQNAPKKDDLADCLLQLKMFFDTEPGPDAE